MKVLFLKDVPGGASASWRKGQIKDVSDGYAQNFLIPKGFAAPATPQVVARVEKEAREAHAKRQKELERLQHLKSEMEKREFKVKVKVGEKGQVFGGVHEKDVAKAVSEKMEMEVGKSQVELSGALKDLGIHQARLKLRGGIVANIKINLIAE